MKLNVTYTYLLTYSFTNIITYVYYNYCRRQENVAMTQTCPKKQCFGYLSHYSVQQSQ